jgi:hypothetical protein
MRLPQKQVEGLDHVHRAEAQLLEPPGGRHEIALLGRVEQFQRIVLGEHRHAPQLLERVAAQEFDRRWIEFGRWRYVGHCDVTPGLRRSSSARHPFRGGQLTPQAANRLRVNGKCG